MIHAALLILLAVPAARAADEVHLKGGVTVEGLVEERDGRVIVTNEDGTMAYLPSHVERIDRTKPSRIQDYERRLAAADLSRLEDVEALLQWTAARKMPTQAAELARRALDLRHARVDESSADSWSRFGDWAEQHGASADAAAARERAFPLMIAGVGDSGRLEEALCWAERHGVAASGRRAILWRLLELNRAWATTADRKHEVALWAAGHGLEAEARTLHGEALALDPDHEASRRELGYEHLDGRWMTFDEIRAAQGLVSFEGAWITPADRDAVVEGRIRLERERRVVEEEWGRLAARREAMERELARASEEAARLRDEVETRQAELRLREERIARELANLRRAYFRRAYFSRTDGWNRFDTGFGFGR